MIIRNNLASSPVKNHTLFAVTCVALFIAAIAFTGFNLKSLITGYLFNNRLESQITAEQKRMLQLKEKIDVLNGKIKVVKTPDFINETEFANEAIRKRVFSWTTLFDQLERAFPGNVKMVSVYPAFSNQDIKITMEVSGRSLNDIVDLVRRLQAAPMFDSVYFVNEHRTDEGLYVTIGLRYLPDKASQAEKEEAAQSQPSSETEPPAEEEEQ